MCSLSECLRPSRNSPVTSFMSKDRFSTPAWVDMKGIQVGLRELLDRLYFLRRQVHMSGSRGVFELNRREKHLSYWHSIGMTASSIRMSPSRVTRGENMRRFV